MTKKDFEAIAALLRKARLQYDGDRADDVTEYIAKGVADVCAARNGRFDRVRFLRACRFEE
jgi:hypothetical protein